MIIRVICGQKNNYQGGLHGREKINLFDLRHPRLIIKFQTYYYSFQKLNFPFHQRNSFKSVSSVVKKRTIKEIFTLVIKNPLVSSAFNVQVSGLHLKIIRATFNYIKDNR